jgi:hypothetical protein
LRPKFIKAGARMTSPFLPGSVARHTEAFLQQSIRGPLVFRAAFPLFAYFITAFPGATVSVVTCAGAAVLLGLALRGRLFRSARC